VALTALALAYSAGHFRMTTDTAELISTKQAWRQRELAFEAAYPQLQKLIIVVIDGPSLELADDGAARLASALSGNPRLFRIVRQPGGGAFFEREGALFLPLQQVRETAENLARSGPFLAPLVMDPSLRGVVAPLAGAVERSANKAEALQAIEPEASALSSVIENALAGKPAYFSWRRLMSMSPESVDDTRRVILVQPVLDYTALQPGAAASEEIRRIARDLHLAPQDGFGVRLTGPVPLGDEEFASLAKDANVVAGAMIAALVGILWLAVRSARILLAILLATIAGLIMTAGLGLLATGRFNLISVAFIPLFVGLGIDFSIQLSVRFLAERIVQPDLRAALVAAGSGVGKPLGLAAAAIGLGFFAFLPTSYLGVAELGTIAGLGMIVAFVLSLTLLPALISLLRPRARGTAEVGYPRLAPVEAFLRLHYRPILAFGLVVAIVAGALLPFLRFDFDPLHLKGGDLESMTTLRDLTANPDWTLNSIHVQAKSQAEAETLARRLSSLPQVSRTVTLANFVPTEQDAKLTLIHQAAASLEPILNAPRVVVPSDLEIVQSLSKAAADLKLASPIDAVDPASVAARRLGVALERLVAAPPEMRASVTSALIGPFDIMLKQIRSMLKAAPVTPETLPGDLVADWTTNDGHVRLQVFPRADQDDAEALLDFSKAVQEIAPDATGAPISIHAAGESILTAFLQAGAYSAVTITILLFFALRRTRDVLLTMLPVFLSGLLTFAFCAILGLPLNFTNIIALPLLFGVGVAFNIYFVMAWRAGEAAPLQSSLMRAVLFSALTTATAFGALWLSGHPGTASMGRLLMISLGWELVVTLFFRPALLARPPATT
jgi:hopanoid biosynthesis associated RND transporter like protein HpnN